MLAFQQGIICLDTDLEILGEVGVAHVAGIHECVMEGERALEVYRSLTCNTKTQIFVQKRPVFGRSAVVDDCASSVDRIEVTEIGDALCVAGEVARATDTIHHTGAENVCGVHVAEDVSFESGVHCDDT